MLDPRKRTPASGHDRVSKRFVNPSESGNPKGESKGNPAPSEAPFCILVARRSEELEFPTTVNEVGYPAAPLGVKALVNVVFGAISFFNARSLFVALRCAGRESGEVAALATKSPFSWRKGGHKGGLCWGKGKVDQGSAGLGGIKKKGIGVALILYIPPPSSCPFSLLPSFSVDQSLLHVNCVAVC